VAANDIIPTKGRTMHARMIGSALAALMLLPVITPIHGEQAGTIIAREQAFYETLTFGPPLRAGTLYAVLDPLSERPDFVARLFRGVPGCLGTRGARLEGSEVKIDLIGKGSDGSKKVYGVNVIDVDFAGDMHEEGDHMIISWYHCKLCRTHSHGARPQAFPV
jgi:hypothetical protein